MSENESQEHIHLLSSYEAGWDGLHLIYEQEPVDEIQETNFAQHLLIICLDNVRVSWMLNRSWQHIDYTNGDIGIFPVSQFFPRAQVDRKVRIIDLFLEPSTLASAAFESVDPVQIELVPQLHLRDPLIYQMGLALKAELEIGKADSRFYAESITTALSVHLLRRYSAHQQQIQNYRNGLPKYKLREAIAYIHEHLDQSLTLTELAASVQMSSHYFTSLFKQSTGFTPHQYVTKCRIDKAKQLLQKHDLTLVEISGQVGFQNQSHFTRVFRQHTTTTPKAYRESL